jgi:membrane-associated phospholipid phosphatase
MIRIVGYGWMLIQNREIEFAMTSSFNVDDVASFLGQHAIALLGLSFVLMFSAALFFWNFLDRNERKVWQFAANTWHQIQNLPVLRRFRERFPWLWNTVKRRFSPESYLGLHFTIAICVLLITATAFLMLAGKVGEQDTLVEFDRALSASLHQHSSLRSVKIFELITTFGNVATLACIGLIVAMMLAVQRRVQLLVIWVVALLGVGFLNHTLKGTFRRMRPQLPNPWINEPGWSFPSGHAMASLVVYGMLAYTLGLMVEIRAFRIGLIFVTVSLVLAIGFSRIYLGAHYFSDVLAGYFAASFWLAICISGNEIAKRHRHHASARNR